jgi:hypothetical protein
MKKKERKQNIKTAVRNKPDRAEEDREEVEEIGKDD